MESTSDQSEELSPEVFLSGVFTTLLIGGEEKQYIVHKGLLCNKVGYFTAAYRNGTKEATENIFHIKDISDSSIRSLVSWLYTGKIFLNPGKDPELERDPDLQELLEGTESSAGSATDSDKDSEYSEPPLPVEQELEQLREDNDYQETLPVLDTTNQSPQEVENTMIRHVFSEANPDDLEAYQLESLIRLYDEYDPCRPFLAKWKSRLETQNAEASTQAVNNESNNVSSLMDSYTDSTFDRLLELYIIADRFEIPLLSRQVLPHFEAHYQELCNLIHGRSLPTYAFVHRAFESLPAGSGLLEWLVQIFANRWSAISESAEERAAREELPREFLVNLINTLAKRRSEAEHLQSLSYTTEMGREERSMDANQGSSQDLSDSILSVDD